MRKKQTIVYAFLNAGKPFQAGEHSSRLYLQSLIVFFTCMSSIFTQTD